MRKTIIFIAAVFAALAFVCGIVACILSVMDRVFWLAPAGIASVIAGLWIFRVTDRIIDD